MGNLLVLAAGRRRYVLQELLGACGSADRVLAADSDLLTPGLSLDGVEAIQEPEGDVDDWLIGTCASRRVDAVLSLHDYQAIRVSGLRERLAAGGTRWIGPGPSIATTLLDKAELAQFLSATAPGLAIPTFTATDSLPADVDLWVVKERLGSGSSGLQVGLTRGEAQCVLSQDLVAQPLVGGSEWNLDFFIWGDGEIRGVSAKRKIRMRGGETDAAEVIPSTELPFDVTPVLDAFRGIDHLGNVDLDLFVDGDRLSVVDVNPRFGGGFAFSAKAGYEAAAAVWSMTNGEDRPFRVESRHRFVGAKSIDVVEL